MLFFALCIWSMMLDVATSCAASISNVLLCPMAPNSDAAFVNITSFDSVNFVVAAVTILSNSSNTAAFFVVISVFKIALTFAAVAVFVDSNVSEQCISSCVEAAVNSSFMQVSAYSFCQMISAFAVSNLSRDCPMYILDAAHTLLRYCMRHIPCEGFDVCCHGDLMIFHMLIGCLQQSICRML